MASTCGWMHRRFLDGLAAKETPYAVISGSHQQRLQTPVELIDPLLQSGQRQQAGGCWRDAR